MVSRMRLTSLLFASFACLAVGCSSETTGPATTSDASNTDDDGADTAVVAKTDTAIPGTDTTIPGTDTAMPPSDSPESTTFSEVYNEVLKLSCSSSYCHGSGAGAGGWAFKTDQAATYAQLVGPTSGACSGLKKVEPGQPTKSSLYLKLRGSFEGVCTGERMPQGGSPVTAAQLETVRSWIAGGAKP
jgi:hypothetical protein